MSKRDEVARESALAWGEDWDRYVPEPKRVPVWHVDNVPLSQVDALTPHALRMDRMPELGIGFGLRPGEPIVCSICGGNMIGAEPCGHVAGTRYMMPDGRIEVAVGTMTAAHLHSMSVVHKAYGPGRIESVRPLTNGDVAKLYGVPVETVDALMTGLSESEADDARALAIEQYREQNGDPTTKGYEPPSRYGVTPPKRHAALLSLPIAPPAIPVPTRALSVSDDERVTSSVRPDIRDILSTFFWVGLAVAAFSGVLLGAGAVISRNYDYTLAQGAFVAFCGLWGLLALAGICALVGFSATTWWIRRREGR